MYKREFITPLTLKHEGRVYHVTIRSHKGKPFYATTGKLVAMGATRQEALLRLIEKLC